MIFKFSGSSFYLTKQRNSTENGIVLKNQKYVHTTYMLFEYSCSVFPCLQDKKKESEFQFFPVTL